MALASNNHQRLEMNGLEVLISFEEGAIILLDGVASIFGAPMRENVRYRFVDRHITVCAFGKVRMDITGRFTMRTPQPPNGDLHVLNATLDMRRVEARVGGGSGPVVLLVGDKDTGKSVACRTLINLCFGSSAGKKTVATTSAQKEGGGTNNNKNAQGRDPIGVAYVDLDVGQGAVTCPGSIATAFVEASVPIDDDFTTMIPLVFFFGEKTVTQQSRKRYLDLCAWTQQSIQSVHAAKPDYRAGGVIINTMGWVRDMGYDLLKQIITIFRVTDVVVTGGNDALQESLASDFAFSQDRIAFHKLGATCAPIVAKSGLDRVRTRSVQLNAYFHGTLRTPLAPVRLVVFLKDIVLVDATTLEDFPLKSLRPLTVAALSTASNRELCASSNAAGFVIITDIGKLTLTLLSPAPGKLPRPYLLIAPTIQARTDDIPPFGVS